MVSIDNDPQMQPTVVAEIGNSDYKMLGGGVDAIWCSPPCTQSSIARSKANTPRDLEGADKLVRRCRDMISHFQPLARFMENPHSGMLRSRNVVPDLPSIIIDYCMYAYNYRKHTKYSRMPQGSVGASDVIMIALPLMVSAIHAGHRRRIIQRKLLDTRYSPCHAAIALSRRV